MTSTQVVLLIVSHFAALVIGLCIPFMVLAYLDHRENEV